MKDYLLDLLLDLDAKKLAAKGLFGKPLKSLPSNKEVADAVYQMTHYATT